MHRVSGQHFTESEGGRGKIRYIAGWCIHKLKQNRKRKLVQNLYNRKKVMLVEQLIIEKTMLEHLEVSEHELLETSSDLQSLQEIIRKQNTRRGLTNVSDICFNFFVHL